MVQYERNQQTDLWVWKIEEVFDCCETIYVRYFKKDSRKKFEWAGELFWAKNTRES